MSKPDKVACLVLLGVVMAFSLINNLIWLRIDTRPPRWDEAHYLTMSVEYHRALASGGMPTFVRSLLTVDRTRPPLVPALGAVAFFLLGRSANAALAVNLLAFIFLILAVYGLGAWLASPWSGLLAAFFVSTYPGVFGLSRVFYLDFINIALVAASLYLIVRTEAFSRRGPSVAFGAVMGLGLLCRPFFPVFMIGPLGVSAYAAWRGRRLSVCTRGPGRPRLWVNSGQALVACALVAAPWYMINFVPVVWRSLSAAFGAEAISPGPSNPFALHAILSYFIVSANLHTTPFGTVIFLSAAVILWVKRPCPLSEVVTDKLRPLYSCLILLCSILVPLVFFSTLRPRDLKNIAPVLPAIAVISSWGLSLFEPNGLKKGLIGFAIVASLFQFWVGTYGVQALPQEVGLRLGSRLHPFLIYRQATANPDEGFHLLPRREHWPIPEILSRITGGSLGPGGTRVMARPAVLAIIPDHALFNGNNFQYFAVLKDLPVRVQHPGNVWSADGKDYRTSLLGVDFAVIKTGDPGPAWLNPFNMEMVEFLRSPDSRFGEVGPPFSLPDGSQAILYARRR